MQVLKVMIQPFQQHNKLRLHEAQDVNPCSGLELSGELPV